MSKSIFISLLLFTFVLNQCSSPQKEEEKPKRVDAEKPELLVTFEEINIDSLLNAYSLTGSIALYDYNNQKWYCSDGKDAEKLTVPASTFKIINSLIALEEGIVKNENEKMKWDGVKRDIESWNADTDMKNAYKNSTVWFYQEIARQLSKKKYQYYLEECDYGNKDLRSEIDRFWLDGSLKISTVNQIQFLVKLHEEKLPFSKENIAVVKKIMINDEYKDVVLRAKTGWGKVEASDIGWWIGYVESNENVWFFATRVSKPIEVSNEKFMAARKEITLQVLKRLKIISPVVN